MSIRVSCPDCHKSYAAPDAMRGKRIRCRNCSTVFTVVATAVIDDAPPAQHDDEPSPSETHAGAGAARGRATPSREPPADEFPFSDLGSDPDAVFSSAFQSYKPATRPNYAFKFPTAHLLDRWLPWALTGLGVLWLASETLRSPGRDAPGWVGWMRLGLMLALLGGVVFPLTSVAARYASRKLKFDLPPRARWRVFAAFVLPVAVAVVMWLTARTVGGLMAGGIAGLVVGLATVWLLLRLEPAEAPAALGMVGSAFAVAAAVCVTLVWGMNAIAVAAVEDMTTPTTLAASPFGPGLAWAKPKPVAEEYVPPPADPAGTPAPAPVPDAPVVSATSDPAPDPGASVVFSPTAPPPVPETVESPKRSAPANVAAATAMTPTAPAPSTTTMTTNVPPKASPSSAAAAPIAPPADLFITRIRNAQSPLVDSVASIAIPPAAVVFPTLQPSPAALVVRATNRWQEEALEVWSCAAPAERKFARPPFAYGVSRAYAVSPSGALTFRLVAFPTLSVEVWSNAENTVAKVLPLPQRSARPVICGAIGDERLLLRWDSTAGSESGLEVLDLKTGQPVGRQVTLADHVKGPGNGALSPDGKMYALIGKLKDKPHVSLYTFGALGAPRQTPVTGIDPQWASLPVSMAFSPDGKRLAVLFQHADLGLIYVVRTQDGKAVAQHLLPAGQLPPAPSEFPTLIYPRADASRPGDVRQLSWVGDGSMLVRGNLLVDAENGKVLGTTGATGVLNQWVFGSTAVLVYKEKFEVRLASVQLKGLPGATEPRLIAPSSLPGGMAPPPATTLPALPARTAAIGTRSSVP